MWVRSQNKVVLANVKDVCIYELEANDGSEIVYEFRCYGYGDDYYILGAYSTKEKALEVMDMIQGCITGQLISSYQIAKDCPAFGTEFHGVFQMPADWSEKKE